MAKKRNKKERTCDMFGIKDNVIIDKNEINEEEDRIKCLIRIGKER